jgi:hypothetical protein
MPAASILRSSSRQAGSWQLAVGSWEEREKGQTLKAESCPMK